MGDFIHARADFWSRFRRTARVSLGAFTLIVTVIFVFRGGAAGPMEIKICHLKVMVMGLPIFKISECERI